jgi:hypothetical protein
MQSIFNNLCAQISKHSLGDEKSVATKLIRGLLRFIRGYWPSFCFEFVALLFFSQHPLFSLKSSACGNAAWTHPVQNMEPPDQALKRFSSILMLRTRVRGGDDNP